MGVFQVVWPKVFFEFKKDSAFRICCHVFSFHGDLLHLSDNLSAGESRINF